MTGYRRAPDDPPPPAAGAAEGSSRRGGPAAAAGYGPLSIGLLALVSAGSAGGLVVFLALLVTGRARVAGLPYADIPIALVALGAATSLACLASAAAFLAERLAAADGEPAAGGRAAQVLTVLLMTGAYVAFAAGGGVFIHFCWAAMAVLGRPAASPGAAGPFA